LRLKRATGQSAMPPIGKGIFFFSLDSCNRVAVPGERKKWGNEERRHTIREPRIQKDHASPRKSHGGSKEVSPTMSKNFTAEGRNSKSKKRKDMRTEQAKDGGGTWGEKFQLRKRAASVRGTIPREERVGSWGGRGEIKPTN